MKKKIIGILSVIVILLIMVFTYDYKTNDNLKKAEDNIKNANIEKRKIKPEINKPIGDVIDETINIIDNNYVEPVYYYVQENNNINIEHNNENTIERKSDEDEVVNEDKIFIDIYNYLISQINDENTIVGKYFANNATKTLDSTGTNTGRVVKDAMVNDNIVNNYDFSFKIIKTNNNFKIYISDYDIKNLPVDSIGKAKEFNIDGNMKSIDIIVKSKVQEKDIIINTMNLIKLSASNDEIINELLSQLKTSGFVMNNYFKNNTSLDSSGGANGLKTTNLLKDNLNLVSDYNVSFKIVKNKDLSYDIYILNNFDISKLNIGDKVDNVYKYNTNDLSKYELVTLNIEKNNNNKNIMN